MPSGINVGAEAAIHQTGFGGGARGTARRMSYGSSAGSAGAVGAGSAVG